MLMENVLLCFFFFHLPNTVQHFFFVCVMKRTVPSEDLYCTDSATYALVVEEYISRTHPTEFLAFVTHEVRQIARDLELQDVPSIQVISMCGVTPTYKIVLRRTDFVGLMDDNEAELKLHLFQQAANYTSTLTIVCLTAQLCLKCTVSFTEVFDVEGVSWTCTGEPIELITTTPPDDDAAAV